MPSDESHERLSANWKQFEEVVAWLESTLGGTSCQIERNARVPGVTGRRREVDVLVRVPYAGRDLLILIECRARRRGSDITWIEQLATKRDRLRAAKVVVVTNVPLSPEASDAAAHYGMDVRLLRDLHEAQILDLIEGVKVTVMSWHLLSVDHMELNFDQEGVRPFLIKGRLEGRVDDEVGWLRIGRQVELLRSQDAVILGFHSHRPGSEYGVHDALIRFDASPENQLNLVDSQKDIPLQSVELRAKFEFLETQLLIVSAADYTVPQQDDRVFLRHRHRIRGATFETRIVTNTSLSVIYQADIALDDPETGCLPLVLSYQLRLSMTTRSNALSPG